LSKVFKRNGAYWIDFKDLAERRHRRRIGPSKKVAEEVLNDIENKITRRLYLGIVDDSKITFAAFVEEWWQRVAYTLAQTTQKRWRSIAELHLLPAFPGLLRNINAAQVESYMAKRAGAGAAPWTIRQELNVLTHILYRAVKWQFIGRNPLLDPRGEPQIRMPKAPPGPYTFS
jgi:hypothetical protein